MHHSVLPIHLGTSNSVTATSSGWEFCAGGTNGINPLLLIFKPLPPPLIANIPIMWYIMIYWDDLVLGGLGAFSIRGGGYRVTIRGCCIIGFKSEGSYRETFLEAANAYIDIGPKLGNRSQVRQRSS